MQRKFYQLNRAFYDELGTRQYHSSHGFGALEPPTLARNRGWGPTGGQVTWYCLPSVLISSPDDFRYKANNDKGGSTVARGRRPSKAWHWCLPLFEHCGAPLSLGLDAFNLFFFLSLEVLLSASCMGFLPSGCLLDSHDLEEVAHHSFPEALPIIGAARVQTNHGSDFALQNLEGTFLTRTAARAVVPIFGSRGCVRHAYGPTRFSFPTL